MQQKRTELAEIGEFGLINRLKTFVPAQNYHKNTITGIGDDCAVLDNGNDEYTLISTDILAENIHFDLAYTPLVHLGYKAVVVNLSDIVAMNGTPQQITVSVALSNRFSVEAIEEFYKGIKIACENYKVDLVGGDTTSSKSGFFVSITAIGKVKKDKIVYRNGAKIGDIICVTGDLGGAFLGLKLLSWEKEVFLANPEMQPELTGKEYPLQRQLRPEARLDMVQEWENLGVKPTAMLDISDGLASEILHICEQSQVGAFILEENLPIDTEVFNTAVEHNLPPVTCAMNGGEDYELLCTFSPEDFDKIRKKMPDLTAIGVIKEKELGAILQTNSKEQIKITAQGWKHF
jgi:thiamine-monophosphate kinase